MTATTHSTLSTWISEAWAAALEPLRTAPWGELRDFWLAKIFDDRFLVAWFLPLVPLLLLVPARHLRAGLLVGSCAFIGYVFGAAYLAFWLLAGVALFYFSEHYARRCRRPGARPWAPPLLAVGVIVGVYVGTLLVRWAFLPIGLNAWLHENLPFLFPLGSRGLWWEPSFRPFEAVRERLGFLPLLTAMFFDAHTIGTAYLLVRMLHYFSELRRDGIPPHRRTLLNFLTYISYGPALIQGPLERYGVFQDELDTCHARRSPAQLPAALTRIGLGVVKSIFAQLYLRPAMYYNMGLDGNPQKHFHYFDYPESISTPWLYLGLFVPIFWIYIEMSGYVDISAGIARLLGYRQVENFNKPWLATSLRDFWRRWHISLSMILRDYIYIPLGGNRRHQTLNNVVTFAICGAWHPPVLAAASWGVVMGLMLAVNQRWVEWMKRVDAAPGGTVAAIRRAVLRVPLLPQILGWVVTQHAFVWSLLMFNHGPLPAIRVPWELARRLLAS